MEGEPSVRVRLLLPVLVAVILAGAVPHAQSTAASRDAAKMQATLSAILVRAATPAPAGKPRPPLKNSFTDAQFNAWLQADGKENLPVGLINPVVTFFAGNKVTAKAVVDLDAVRQSKPRGMLDPMNLMTGFIPVTMTGTLSGRNGQGRFDVETWTLGSWTLPRSVLQELITFFSKSEDFPNGITLGQPFPLPAAVRDLAITRGLATVVQ
jgi:hypothetical protein